MPEIWTHYREDSSEAEDQVRLSLDPFFSLKMDLGQKSFGFTAHAQNIPDKFQHVWACAEDMEDEFFDE